ncbi:MAG: hypothetical protein PHT31_02535 [Candidatus Omnitrophica bacterium]|nr:hypothetical protein [Candidatus Omnitrophota bacterium]MDD5653025.1 hypothetical protein [Candidatus Omnitrophota bacterium]
MPIKAKLFLFLIFFSFSSFAFADNLIKNPDMEQGSPTAWTSSVNKTANRALYASDSYHSAARSLKIINTVSGISNWKGNRYTFKSGSRPKKIYYSAWVKGENISVTGAVFLNLVVTFTDGRRQVISDLRFPSGTYNWTQVSLNKTFTKSVKSFQPYFYFSGGIGTAWFDDLSIGTNGSNNYALNPNMEEGKPLNWAAYTTSSNKALYAADNFHSGARSLEIINLLPRVSYWKGDVVKFSKPYPKQFKASVWAKGASISANSIVAMYFRVVFDNNSSKAFYADQRFPSGTFDWIEKQDIKTFTRGIKSIQPCVYFSAGRGTAWFDDFSLSTQINTNPQITNVVPEDNSDILLGANVNITVIATDSDNDVLEYQFSIAGTVKQAWSSANTYAWVTQTSDLGLNSVLCEVRDNKGGTDSKTISLRVLNPSVEEILQKVANNYALVSDLTADMTLTSTLNGEPFGQTDYCKYYFKAPSKERTDSFSDATRLTKVEANIMNGSNMYLIDTINKIVQPVDLLNEAGINSAQFSQMDLYYNQSNFLDNHTVTKNTEKSDLVNFVVTFDAVPKEQNNLYSKLELYIDYKKGLLKKSCLYKQNTSGQSELLQTIETVESQQMPNGAWVVKKMQKTPVLKSGNLIDTASYENQQVNIGLNDTDFDPEQQ